MQHRCFSHVDLPIEHKCHQKHNRARGTKRGFFVIVSKKNLKAKNDNLFINLLSRVCEGRAWNGHKAMSDVLLGMGNNYIVSDYETLMSVMIPEKYISKL